VQILTARQNIAGDLRKRRSPSLVGSRLPLETPRLSVGGITKAERSSDSRPSRARPCATLAASRAGRVVVSNAARTEGDRGGQGQDRQGDAADCQPAVWLRDAAINPLRRQMIRRLGRFVSGPGQEPNPRDHAPQSGATLSSADLFDHQSRRWLSVQDLPADEQTAAAALLPQLDFHTEKLRPIDQELGRFRSATLDGRTLRPAGRHWQRHGQRRHRHLSYTGVPPDRGRSWSTQAPTAADAGLLTHRTAQVVIAGMPSYRTCGLSDIDVDERDREL
jgi:hypothetical protein